ncbi:hypothetical protein L313_2801 [Acinetobacter haemolyticus CIP 64.3 = MTCC 9819]|uniref:Uncharacterized protein n=1 Tax=Acinetobacter haemolyticus CIP 64.3 = MTCC 9819 TaxID=1217659 RepID=N9EYK4_ACIHA|nr:hypothetical protein [Acinetobacter haemolyticus]ENW15618.1 hypothetical protein F927_03358 [Acinetobacter haemolyticus CIP 64.3 = MTCC 9819]EPR90391.1 hypothetical protein L313_2801 [Acinetobacter haemolyticus CIP 64.3 = MTCC 9819]QXZ26470.1 hypothetical protein I6L22_15070 [Acinetobacter haemolyticus]SPT48659.1 Uncharacterised protein [Acinetobacter haemolyticus]SUU61811.1 Uncharacterised protein [Acinetobacter haemolyticus]
MCGGSFGKIISSVTNAFGLTDTKADAKGFDAQAADSEAKRKAQEEANVSIAQRKKRKASEVLSSTSEDDKKNTLGG